MKIKKHQISLFLVAMTASAPAEASTCSPGFYDPANGSNCVAADAGYYVPTAGATAQIAAPPGRFVPAAAATVAILATPGHYVPTSGATGETIAPAGTFVDVTGASAPTLSPAGFYVPAAGQTSAILTPAGYFTHAGASAPVAPGTGFYALFTGQTDAIPMGGLAAPLTAATQTENVFDSMSSDLLDTDGKPAIRLATAYQHASVHQQGLLADTFGSDIGAVAIQADFLRSASNSTGVQFALGHHNLTSSSDVKNNGNSFEAGAYHSGNLYGANYQAFFVYGQTDYDNKRNVNITYFNSGTQTNVETDRSSGTVHWYGLRSKWAYPVLDRLNAIGHLGILSYNTGSVNETSTASLNGSATTPVSRLRAGSLQYIYAPVMLGISYDLVQKAPKQAVAPVTFETGLVGNFAPTPKLSVTSVYAPAISDNLPIDQTSTVQGLFKVKFNAWEFANGINLSGVAQAQLGLESSALQVGFHATKEW